MKLTKFVFAMNIALCMTLTTSAWSSLPPIQSGCYNNSSTAKNATICAPVAATIQITTIVLCDVTHTLISCATQRLSSVSRGGLIADISTENAINCFLTNSDTSKADGRFNSTVRTDAPNQNFNEVNAHLNGYLKFETINPNVGGERSRKGERSPLRAKK